MKNKKLRKWLWIIILCLITYIVLDYINLPSRLSIAVENMNIGLLSLIVDTSVVILLYITTYFIVDERQIKREENTRNTGKLLLKHVYEKCLDTAQFFLREDCIYLQLIQKELVSDEVVREYENRLNQIPFDSENEIHQLAKEGFISPEDLDMYFSMCSEYSQCIAHCFLAYRLDLRLEIDFNERKQTVQENVDRVEKLAKELLKNL